MFSYYKLHQVYLTLRVSMILLLGLTKPRVAFNASLNTLGFVMLRLGRVKLHVYCLPDLYTVANLLQVI